MTLLRPVAVLLSLLLMLATNALATLLPINDLTTAELSARYPIPLTPAGYVFSIWGLIYLVLIGFSLYQARRTQQQSKTIDAIGWLFVFSNLLNSAWIFAWHYEELLLSVGIMIGLLISLIGIYQIIHASLKGKWDEGFSWFVRVPFSIYLGWISVATVVNVAVLLYDTNWNGFGLADVTWSAILIGIVTTLTLTLLIQRRDFAYTGVIVWALIGIIVAHSDKTPVPQAAGLAILILFLTALLRLFPSADQRRRHGQKNISDGSARPKPKSKPKKKPSPA